MTTVLANDFQKACAFLKKIDSRGLTQVELHDTGLYLAALQENHYMLGWVWVPAFDNGGVVTGEMPPLPTTYNAAYFGQLPPVQVRAATDMITVTLNDPNYTLKYDLDARYEIEVKMPLAHTVFPSWKSIVPTTVSDASATYNAEYLSIITSAFKALGNDHVNITSAGDRRPTRFTGERSGALLMPTLRPADAAKFLRPGKKWTDW